MTQDVNFETAILRRLLEAADDVMGEAPGSFLTVSTSPVFACHIGPDGDVVRRLGPEELPEGLIDLVAQFLVVALNRLPQDRRHELGLEINAGDATLGATIEPEPDCPMVCAVLISKDRVPTVLSRLAGREPAEGEGEGASA